jgi:hypothetical protein
MGERTRSALSRNAGLALFMAGAALTAISCGGGDVAAPPSTGSLTISTSTTGSEADADGYAVSIDQGTETAIPSTGTLQRDDVEAGNHSIGLSGIAANCTVAGENPRTVSVPAGETVRVDFAVTCAATAGGIEITTLTRGPVPDPDGYAVLINGIERGRIGASNTIVLDPMAPGSYGVGLTGLAGNCKGEGEGLRSVVVVAGARTAVAFEVSCAALAPETGTLRITTNTSGSDVDPDGYALAVDAQASQPIGVEATLALDNLAAGVHTVQLSGNEANCHIAGANPRSVTVPAGGTVDLAFRITCAPQPPTTGTLKLTTSTTGVSPDLDGYTASLDGATGQPIDGNGSITIPDLAPGAHNIGVSGISANCQVEGNNPRSLQITAGQTSTAAFSVRCTAPPPSTGTLRVNVATTGPDQDPSGYTLAIDDQASQAVGVNTTVNVAEVGAGVHTVQLSGLAFNCTLSGTNPRSITVTAGGVADASFSIACTAITGTVQITVTSTGDIPDPDGYTIMVDGGPAQAIAINGSVAFELVSAGQRNVEIGGLAANCHLLGGPNSREVTVAAGATATVAFEVRCPAEIRIVLTWGTDPWWDLDSHLTGPTTSGSRFHIYNYDWGSLVSSPFAELQNDAWGGGPETTIISQLTEGTYRFMVNDYISYYEGSSTALGALGAKVEVYTSQGLIQTFLVPNEPGTLWTVFEITGGTTANPTIVAVNTMTYQSPYASGLSASAQASDAEMIRRAVRAHPKAVRAERVVQHR